MNKTDCYKCNREPSVECGECAVWLADEEVSEKERIAYQQGAKKFAKWLEDNSYLNWVGEGNDVNSMSAEEALTEWQKGKENE